MKPKEDVVEKLLISLLECWNENNMCEKLNPDLTTLIETHLGYAFTVGVESAFAGIKAEIDKVAGSPNQLAKSFVKALINPVLYEF